MTKTIDIERKRGDTKRMVFKFTNETTGNPVDITTGYSFLLTVDPAKDPADDVNNLFQLTGTIIDGTNGRVAFIPTDINADQLGTYYYDIQMVDPNTEKSTPVDGKMKFTQDITKD